MRRRLARRLYGLLLRAYPAELRGQYGDEVRQVFTARLRAARRRGASAGARLWLREILGALRAAAPLGDPATPRSRLSPKEGLVHAMDLLSQDLRFAARTLRKNPGFTLAAVVVLAVGIGANTAIFTVVDAVLLRPLPFHEHDRLLAIWERNPERGWYQAQVAAANYLDWREQASTFAAMAAHNDWITELVLTGDGEPEIVNANEVTGSFFQTLGLEMALGSAFDDGDDWAGGEPKIVLAHAFWRQRFGADPGILGRRLVLDDVPRTVVGIAPEGVSYPFPDVQAWTPVAWPPERATQVSFRRAHGMRVVGRLAPGVDRQEAEAELAAIAARLERQYPETNTEMGNGVTPLHEWVVGETRTPVLVLFAAVGLVLLIACANVANMHLARASRRTREMAVRAALGASRRRMVRQGLTESLLLAFVGGLGGLGLGTALLPWIVRLDPAGSLRLDSLRLDPTVLGFAFVVTLATGVTFGLVPALRASRAGGGGELGADARVATSLRASRTSALLVAIEVALVLPLAIGAGLMVRSLLRLQQVDPGFEAAGTVAFGYSLPRSRYSNTEEIVDFHRRVLESAASIPGVDSVGTSTRLPFRNQRWSSDFRAESWPPDRYGVGVRHDEVSADLFATMGVPLLQGSTFSEAAAQDRILGIVNRALAEQYFPDGDAVGQRLCFDRVAEDCRFWYDIVGVVDNVRRVSLAQEEEPSIYSFILQVGPPAGYLLVRSARSTEDLVAAAQAAVRELDPELPFHTVTTLSSLADESLAGMRLVLVLIATFAVVSLALAALGVYGVVAYTTARRTREIGVRVTLGAAPGDVARTILGRALIPVSIGVVAGVMGAAASARLLEVFLFRVTSFDLLTYGIAVAVLVMAAIVACAVPVRRALSIDPVRALRED